MPPPPHTHATQLARCIEALVILIRANVDPVPGTFSFVEGDLTHDDLEPRPHRHHHHVPAKRSLPDAPKGHKGAKKARKE